MKKPLDGMIQMTSLKERKKVSTRCGRNTGGNGRKKRNLNLSMSGCEVRRTTHGQDECDKRKSTGAVRRNFGAQVEAKSKL